MKSRLPSQYKIKLIQEVKKFVNENKLKTSMAGNTFFVREKNMSVTISLDSTLKVELIAHNCGGGKSFVPLERTTFRYKDRPNLKAVVSVFQKYRKRCKSFYS